MATEKLTAFWDRLGVIGKFALVVAVGASAAAIGLGASHGDIGLTALCTAVAVLATAVTAFINHFAKPPVNPSPVHAPS